MRKICTLFLAFSLALVSLPAQVNYTANQQVTPYNGPYRAGINMGYYPGWNNQTLADIAAGNPALNLPGIGARSNRLGLQEVVLDYFGYGLLSADFQHWKSLGMDEFTAFTSGPTWAHQEKTQYCPGQYSPLFDNLYTPIWDGGANGTPYNDTNYYAAYLYKVVTQYKDEVRFWEVWNEPGFDLTGNLGWRGPEYPGNWWLEGPNPCDYILRAPIYHYTRALRIAWEVIKTVDPDSYVCLSGVGYLSFLNAVLRNTDNPNGGDVSPEYPLLGGAYFDCIAIHSYPHFDGSTINYGANLFERHSDQAADGVAKVVNDYQGILDQYGYDGVTFPKKEWICTEINSPRKAFTGDFFAGHDAQINHMMKAQMVAKINRVHQLHSFQLIDQETEADASYEFHQMGMYEKLDGQPAYQQRANDLGKAMKTMTDLVFHTQYDPVRSTALALPPGVRGYAWKRPDGSYIYSLWARTNTDLSEAAAATYSFPAGWQVTAWRQYDWDYGYTGATSLIAGQNIALDARPRFFTAESTTAPVCQLQASISNVKCVFNTTPDPEDDLYRAVLKVQGINGSGQWTAVINGQPLSGTLGTKNILGPYSIAAGGVPFVVRDLQNDQCFTTVTLMPPTPCSPGPGITDPSDQRSSGQGSQERQSLLVYPNPAQDYVTLDLRAYQGQEGRLRVYNAQGQVLTDAPLAADQSALLHLSLAGYANGAYMVQVQAGAETAVGRIQVIR